MTALRWLLYLPRNAVVVLLRIYRAVVSPLYGEVCRYYPSCSRYGLEAVQEHGVVIGGGLTVARICRCHPWARGGIDDVPRRPRRRSRLTDFGFVIPVPAGQESASSSDRKA
ncbi:MAG: hypothetical protein JWP66_499 [Naasia sp.]|nr:hypothetical protein [Naasia sp.]